jgi:hypothetical protein
MATLSAPVGQTLAGTSGNPSAQSVSIPAIPLPIVLSNAQAGSGASTNVVDTGGSTGPVCIKITTAIGATPSCTYAVEGSLDNTIFFPIQYADSATPQTLVIATFVITTATTVHLLIPANLPVRFIRLTYSANTNVTNTATAYSF